MHEAIIPAATEDGVRFIDLEDSLLFAVTLVGKEILFL